MNRLLSVAHGPATLTLPCVSQSWDRNSRTYCFIERHLHCWADRGHGLKVYARPSSPHQGIESGMFGYEVMRRASNPLD